MQISLVFRRMIPATLEQWGDERNARTLNENQLIDK